jgi:hypothetical protein
MSDDPASSDRPLSVHRDHPSALQLLPPGQIPMNMNVSREHTVTRVSIAHRIPSFQTIPTPPKRRGGHILVRGRGFIRIPPAWVCACVCMRCYRLTKRRAALVPPASMGFLGARRFSLRLFVQRGVGYHAVVRGQRVSLDMPASNIARVSRSSKIWQNGLCLHNSRTGLQQTCGTHKFRN